LEKNKMGFYDAWLFPRVLDLVMQQKQMIPFRERIGKAASGRVLDIGIGSGLNLPFYGQQTDHVYGVDPSAELLQFAEQRARETQVPVELLRGSGEALPLDDKCVDTVVMTFTLCTVSDPARTLAEIRRVLKPGGGLLFAEHGRVPEIGVARWQDRLTPIWKRVAGGCHLNRKPDDLMQSAGFRIENLETSYLKAPRAMGFVYSGSARSN
jgi:ubiquinone/menaquinone biosynthesis C-methylase UbiE